MIYIAGVLPGIVADPQLRAHELICIVFNPYLSGLRPKRDNSDGCSSRLVENDGTWFPW